MEIEQSQKIITSPIDKRIYHVFTLPNQIQALLISDPETDKSAACLNVYVGMLEDPDGYGGLAHFHEHMLFLGTKKFPTQNDYSSYLSKNGSEYDNASTHMTFTDYYFDCSNEGLDGALERLAEFFISPLFTESKTDAEVQAVHSEFEISLSDELWRADRLLHHISFPDHPYHRFTCGNKDSLQKEDINKKLLEFNRLNYSANKMKLCIYSNESIENLKQTATKYFSPIKNFDTPPRPSLSMPFSKANMCKYFEVIPVKDKDVINVIWMIPENLKKEYKNKPEGLITHLFGHEGKNSLLSLLKNEGYAINLMQMAEYEIDLFTLFITEIELTKYGFENYEKVLEIVFAYLRMLKSKEIPEWVYEECKKIKETNFKFKENPKQCDYASELAEKMQQYEDVQDIVVGDYLMEKYEPKRTKEILNQLQAENMMIIMKSKSFEGKTSLAEPYYNVKYNEMRIPDSILDKFENPSQNYMDRLDLPLKNEFIPNDLELIQTELKEGPTKIQNKENSVVWVKEGSKFKIPKAIVFLKIFINNDAFLDNPENYICANLWMDLFKNYINEQNYMADLVGMENELCIDGAGLRFISKGFSDSLVKYVKFFMEQIKVFLELKEKNEFKIYYEKRKLEYSNFFKLKPYKIASYLKSCLFIKNGGIYDPVVLFNTIKNITFEKFQEFEKSWFSGLNFNWFFNGNIKNETALQIVSFSEEILLNLNVPSKNSATKIHISACKLLNEKKFYFEHFISEITCHEESNSVLQICYQFEQYLPKEHFILKLINTYLKETFFDKLRTDQQLGYVVQSYDTLVRGVMGYDFLIVSCMYNTQYIETKITEFINSMYEPLKKMDEEQFEEIIESTLVELTCQDMNINEESDRLWKEIATNQLIFNRKEVYENLADEVEINDVIQAYEQLFFKNKKVFELHLICNAKKEETEQAKILRLPKEPELQKIFKINEFKSSINFHPDYSLI